MSFETIVIVRCDTTRKSVKIGVCTYPASVQGDCNFPKLYLEGEGEVLSRV